MLIAGGPLSVGSDNLYLGTSMPLPVAHPICLPHGPSKFATNRGAGRQSLS
jgi:hypothetical protein